jgi:NADH-quinone oxidoreductase subunit M
MEFITQWCSQHLLTGLVFLPLVLGVLSWIVPSSRTQSVSKSWALFSTVVVFLFSLKLYIGFDEQATGFQFTEMADWIPAIGAHYHLGVDGISLWLILLTTFLMPIAVLSSWNSIQTRFKEYYFLLLFLETGMLGAFVALDSFMFYLFWEAMLIPMYFLIGIWGGKDKVYAAMKFFIYTVVGSLLMLVALFYIVVEHKKQFGFISTDLLDLYKVTLGFHGFNSPQSLLFLAFSLAFAIKVPLFPLHTWLPDAHVQAPTAGSVILAGVLLKMGGYGLLRFAFPLFPEAVVYYQGLFLALSAVAIVYGAWVAMVQPDIKKLVAYSSVSHMGYVVFGLFSLNSIGMNGALYQMLNHGISTGGLFLLVGMIYDRRHTREISEYGGIAKVMPLFTIAFMIMTLSSIALPGTNGFIGEFMILLGGWKANKILAAISALGVIFGAVYMLWMFQRVMFGKITNEANRSLKDLNIREGLILLPLIVLVFYMGFKPNVFLSKMDHSIQTTIESLKLNKE